MPTISKALSKDTKTSEWHNDQYFSKWYFCMTYVAAQFQKHVPFESYLWLEETPGFSFVRL